MKSMKKAVVYGLAVWVIPFAVAIMIFPIGISDRALFESIMPVVVTFCTVSFSILIIPTMTIGFGYLAEKGSSPTTGQF